MSMTVIIADVQSDYMQRLQQFMGKFHGDDINFICCAGDGELKAALHGAEDPLVLIAEELAVPVQKVLWDVPTVILTENRDTCAVPEAHTIWKYQRIDRLYDEITAAYNQKDSLILFHRPAPWKVILFQGASGGVGTSTMAAVCARSLAQMGKKVFYLNLELLGTSDFYFQSSEGMDLGHFLQEMENGADAPELIESSAKRDACGVAYLSSVRNASDNCSINLQMLQKAIAQLSVSGLFDYCVIDKTFSFEQSHLGWMDASDLIVFVVDGSETGNLKFVRAFLNMDKDKLSGKTLLLYNKVQPGAFKELSHMELPVLGKVEYLQAPDRRAIEQQILDRRLFFNL